MIELLLPETAKPLLIHEMRSWIKDCSWPDIDEDDVDEMDEQEILEGVERHYSGGIDQFIVDAQPYRP